MERPSREPPESSPTRRRRRRWKGRVLLLGLLAGLFFSVEGKIHLLRLVSLRTLPSGVFSETLAWDLVSGTEQRFWPLLWLRRGDFERRLESRYPLTAWMRLSGWGAFTLQVTPLRPRLRFFWQNQVWLADAEGRVWKANLRENTRVRGLRPPGSPMVYWEEGMPPLLSGGDLQGDVAATSLPLEEIQKWVVEMDRLTWLGTLEALAVRREDGTVRILGSYRKGQQRIRLLLPEERADWGRIFGALEVLWSRESQAGSRLLVDATYKDRIIVRSDDVPSLSN